MKRIQSVVAGLLLSLLFSVYAYAATENDMWAEMNRKNDSNVVLSVNGNGNVTDGLIEIRYADNQVELIESSLIVSENVDMYSLNTYQNVIKIAFVCEEGQAGSLFEISFTEKEKVDCSLWKFSGAVHGKNGETLNCLADIADNTSQNSSAPGNSSENTNPNQSAGEQTNPGQTEQNVVLEPGIQNSTSQSANDANAETETSKQDSSHRDENSQSQSKPTAGGNSSSPNPDSVSKDTSSDNSEAGNEDLSEESNKNESAAVSEETTETQIELTANGTTIENEQVPATDGQLENIVEADEKNPGWLIAIVLICILLLAGLLYFNRKKKANS